MANRISTDDPVLNLGAKMLKDVAFQTSTVAGDRTTTAEMLAKAIYCEGLKAVAGGMDPMDLKCGIDGAVALVAAELRRMSAPCKDTRVVAQVAQVSSNTDPLIGELLASAIAAVGKEGVITIEPGSTIDDHLELVEVLRFDEGYLSLFFVNSVDKNSVILVDPLILLHDKQITQVPMLLAILEEIASANRQFLVIAEGFSDEVLALLVANNLRGTAGIAATKAPGVGGCRTLMLEDIAIVTGGKMVSGALDGELERVKLAELGTARRVTLSSSETVIIDGAGSVDAVDIRVEQLRQQVAQSTSECDRVMLEERVRRLTSGAAVIKIGAATESEMKEKADRVQCSLIAARAAVEEGIVPGGGVALMRACQAIQTAQLENAAQAAGFLILGRAAEESLRQIVRKAGGDESVVLDRVKGGTGSFGYDPVAEEFGDLLQMGVVDPT